MIKFFTILFVAAAFSFAQQSFVRSAEIPVPEIENTGIGAFVSGMDFDGDGKKEIYGVNSMFDNGGNELIPRIYKWEWNGSSWDSVWSATLDYMPSQNTWPPLISGDWDNDGKGEIIWGPVNNFDAGANPNRIIVFEAAGDGTDRMGVDNFGNYLPNAQWTITTQDNFNLRPFKWELLDFDNDGKKELIYASRVDQSGPGNRFGVVSVTNIPDNGDGTEVWTLEASGNGATINTSTLYDMAIIDNTIYLMHSDGSVTPVKYSNNTYTVGANQANLIPGGTWKSSSVVDINGDSNEEIVAAAWQTNGPGNRVYLLQPSGDTLSSTMIVDASSLIGATGRFNGGDAGDIDLDGKMDFVFGTRDAEPNAAIVRVEYQGGDIKNPASYTSYLIDSLFYVDPAGFEGRWDNINIANVDGDGALEVLYNNGLDLLTPIIILDPQISVSVESEISPDNFFLKQNYPNPFNPATLIQFGINEGASVSLRVYSVLGEEVAVLIDNEFYSSGVYNVKFNAGNLSSGTYIYTLTAGNKILSGKMNLLK